MNITEMFALQKAQGFPWFLRGDILLTNHRGAWLGETILEATTAEGEKPSKVQHSLMYEMAGIGIEANHRVERCKMEKYFKGKHDVYLMRRKNLSSDQRSRKVMEMIKQLGMPYDYRQILGFWLYNKLGWEWLKGWFQIPGLNVCSTAIEIACINAELPITEEMVNNAKAISPDITYERFTPDDLFDIAVANPETWELRRLA